MFVRWENFELINLYFVAENRKNQKFNVKMRFLFPIQANGTGREWWRVNIDFVFDRTFHSASLEHYKSPEKNSEQNAERILSVGSIREREKLFESFHLSFSLCFHFVFPSSNRSLARSLANCTLLLKRKQKWKFFISILISLELYKICGKLLLFCSSQSHLSRPTFSHRQSSASLLF